MVSTLVAKSKKILQPIFEMELVEMTTTTKKTEQKQRENGRDKTASDESRKVKRIPFPVLSFIRFSEDVLA